MAKKKQSVPEYGTVTRKGTLYYRTRITDADGKQVSLYAYYKRIQTEYEELCH